MHLPSKYLSSRIEHVVVSDLIITHMNLLPVLIRMLNLRQNMPDFCTLLSYPDILREPPSWGILKFPALVGMFRRYVTLAVLDHVERLYMIN
jgi:hypothetical protein